MTPVHTTDSKHIFRVESDSDADKLYVVDMSDPIASTCTCVAFIMRRNRGETPTCKHIDYVLDFMRSDRVQQDIAAAKAEEDDALEYEKIKTVESLKSMLKEFS